MQRGRFGREEYRYRDAQRGGGSNEQGGQRGGEFGGQERRWGGGGGQWRGGRGESGREQEFQRSRSDDQYGGEQEPYGYRGYGSARDYPREPGESGYYGRQRGRSAWRGGEFEDRRAWDESGSNDRGGFGSRASHAGSQSRYAGGSYSGSAYGGAQEFRGGRQEQFGRFAGRGPRGYRRSDERIKEEICDILTSDADIDATEIIVEVKSGEVTLSGSVDDRDQKRYAEDVAESVQGVNDVRNEIRVQSSAQQGSQQGGAAGATPQSAAGGTQKNR